MDPLSRRTFVKAALGMAAVANGCAAPQPASKSRLPELAPGVKISLQIPRDPSEEDIKFAQQIGVEYVNTFSGGEDATLEKFQRFKERAEGAGLKVWNIGNTNVHNMPEVTLNLPGRDEKIEEYKTYLRNLAKAGLFYTTYAHMGNGIWSSEREFTRGRASARAFD